MKVLIIIILIFQTGLLSAQKVESNLMIGTWRLEKIYDLRKIEEKSDFVDIMIDAIETDNESGYPDWTFKKNNLFEIYYTKDNIRHGKWEVKKDTLFIYNLIPMDENRSESVLKNKYLKLKLIFKGTDGNYYFKARKKKIKKITKDKIEIGTDKEYLVYKKTK